MGLSMEGHNVSLDFQGGLKLVGRNTILGYMIGTVLKEVGEVR